MLGIGPASDFQHESEKILLATDRRNGNHIYYLMSDSDDLPVQKIKSDVFSLLDAETYHKIVRKWGLKKNESKLLRDFFSQRSDDVLDLEEDNNYRIQAAFRQIEDMLVHILKTQYYNKGAKLYPHFTPTVFAHGSTTHLGVIGVSGQGKTVFVCQLLSMPQYLAHEVYILSATPDDPSFDILRKNRKKKNTHFLDIDKIDEPLTIDMFRQRKGKNCIVYADDVLDALSTKANTQQAVVRNWLISLFTAILVKGRAENIQLICVFHKARQGGITQSIYEECQQLLTFPRSNAHGLKELLTRKMAISKKTVDSILKKSGNSRWILWRFSQPMCAISEHSVFLL